MDEFLRNDMIAICIHCGAKKKEPWYKCRNCGYTPTGKDLIKSVYCSTRRYQDHDAQKEYELELERISAERRTGKAIGYDDRELDRLERQQKDVDEVPASAVWGTVFRLFLPGIIFLVLLYLILAFLRR